MESGKEREVGKPRVHAVYGCYYILVAGFDDTAVIHLVNTDVCGGVSNHMGDFPVCVKVSGTAGADAELSHRYSCRLVDEQVTCKSRGDFYLLDYGTAQLVCIHRVNIFDIQNPFGKAFLNFFLRKFLFHAPADKAFDIHST